MYVCYISDLHLLLGLPFVINLKGDSTLLVTNGSILYNLKGNLM